MPVSFRRQIYLVSLENHFMQFAVILVILGEFFKYYLYSLEYAEKYTQSVSHNLHVFVQIVSEAARRCSVRKVFVLIKFTRTWGIELVSLNKNHKIPENSSYFRDAFRTH